MTDEKNVRQPCPVCEAEAFTLTWETNKHQYGECGSCGLAFVRPFELGLTAEVGEAASSVTKPSYLQMMAQHAEERGRLAEEMAFRRLEFYEGILGRKVESICEVGAGDGAFFTAYQNLRVTYVGLDVNRQMVERAHTLGRNLLYGGPEVALELGKSFDVVFCSQVLEHVLEPVSFLNKVWQLLTEDGILHVDVPNHNGLTATIRKVYPHHGEYGFLQPPHHQIAYTRRSLAYLLRNTGFEPLWIRPKSNFDPIWGQLAVGPSSARRQALRVAGWFGMGSLLVMVGRKRNLIERSEYATSR